MSYSRWSCSRWYTYWCVQDEGVEETRDNATFEICAVASFTAKQLREDMDGCVEAVVAACRKDEETHPSVEELEELRGYMREFIADIDDHFKEPA